MPSLRPHQQAFIDRNPNQCLLFWACRSGKSLPAKIWAEHPSRSEAIVVVCPKKLKADWQTHLPQAQVFTKEEIKKVPTPHATALILEEVHTLASPLFIARQRSQMAEAVYNILMKNEGAHVLLLSGTPITNNPASLHTVLTYLGKDIEWKKFREYFYTFETRPYLPRATWFPKKDWRKKAYATLEKYSGGIVDIVSLQEAAPYLPEIIEDIETLPEPPPDPEAETWQAEHRNEQRNKTQWLVDCGYRKAIICAHYREQIEAIDKALSNHRNTYVVYGGVKDQAERIKAWQEDPDGFLIISASIAEGIDGYTADVLIFASMSYTYTHFVQMRERLTTLEKDKMKPRHIIYLQAGEWDKRIFKSLQSGKDFDPTQYESTT